jgi:predicted nucleic acid-binding protein
MLKDLALIILSEAAQEFLRLTDSIMPICRDSDNDLILDCAKDAVADYVVTGDEDSLVLKNYEGISIATLRNSRNFFQIEMGHISLLASAWLLARLPIGA